jgi:excisionase family DNA binding protein
MSEPESFEPLLDSSEAATLLNIHPKTLQKMARAGTIPAYRIGDLWRFRASTLDKWLCSVVSSTTPSVP